MNGAGGLHGAHMIASAALAKKKEWAAQHSKDADSQPLVYSHQPRGLCTWLCILKVIGGLLLHVLFIDIKIPPC